MNKITRFKVVGLYDVFTYELPQRGKSFEDTVIWYGENGSGKTTLLKILFHMLSPANNRGHRNALRKIPFTHIEVELSDGTTITATRKSGPTSLPVEHVIRRPDGRVVKFRHIPAEVRDQFLAREHARMREELNAIERSSQQGQRKFSPAKTLGAATGRALSSALRITNYNLLSGLSAGADEAYKHLFAFSDDEDSARYCKALAELDLNVFYISTDRQILSDSLDDPPADPQFQVRNRGDARGEMISATRAAYLRKALAASSQTIHSAVFRASNAGASNSDAVYVDIIKRLSNTTFGADTKKDVDLIDIKLQLRRLRVRNRGFARLNWTPPIDFGTIFPILNSASSKNSEIIALVVRPYIESLNARLDALEPIYRTTTKFLASLRKFLKLKVVKFIMGEGFVIFGPHDKRLDPEQLSSGEQQLLLIFCNVLAARSSASLFIIDEPEISLNVKWQRDLIDALRETVRGADSQLLFATHSIELLTQHVDQVSVLEPQEISQNEIIYEDTHTDNR